MFKDTKLQIKTYCILDSDYHLEEEKLKRYKEAKLNSINLHIWRKKEIENYLISAKVIHRIILIKNPSLKVKKSEIEDLINIEAEKLKQGVTDDFATEIQSMNKRLALKTVNELARELVHSKWQEDKLSRIPGKRLISALSSICHQKYHVSFSPFKLARNMEKQNIDSEIVTLLSKLKENKNFDE